ncbi:MAG: Mini-ribonuclease 3 [Clostridia bacterium]|nr:Mini-ribonuclease 3 [Clostridia bacterium]
MDININPRDISPLSLAYIGDAVYEVYVRTHIMKDVNLPVNKLHKTATGYVKAKAQSDIILAIAGSLTEEETAVFKRGRNAHSYTSAKNADIVDYRRATGFEALIGYLYLSGNTARLEEIIKLSIDYIDNKIL